VVPSPIVSATRLLAALNAISHPAIDAEIADRIVAAPPDTIVVLDMAVLVETDLGAGQCGRRRRGPARRTPGGSSSGE
jgi:dephospho-CoA kinase